MTDATTQPGESDRARSPLEQLLEVQAQDTVADQLHHRLETLPERVELDAAMSAVARIDADVATATEQRDGIRRDLERLEDAVSVVEARRKETDAKLYGGAVNAARELQALQDELASLARRQRSLEDDELELMEQAEPLDAELERLAADRAAKDEEVTRLVVVVAEVEVAIEADLEQAQAARAQAAEGLDANLLGEYERLRTQFGGVGVARLEGKTCGGCHLSLSAVEVDRIRKAGPDELVHCEECGRILVHS